MKKMFACIALLLILAAGCKTPEPPPPAETEGEPVAVEWAIAIHGGALVAIDESRRTEYEDALSGALELGRGILDRGGSSLDAVEQVIRLLEDDPRFNAGRGAVFTHEGTNELDASIMDGRDLSSGAVTGVTTVKNPISLARKVMEESPHVFFAGAGAEKFAEEQGLKIVDPRYFFTQERFESLQRKLEELREQEQPEPAAERGTVGCVALDRQGNLAAGTSTGGLTNKRFGRIGDSPVIGSGNYANNKTCAVSGTGKGEQFIRHQVAHEISALMEYKGLSLEEAAELVVHRKLEPNDGGIIGVAHDGSIALVFNTPGMFRGAADSSGRFEVGVWKDGPPAE